MALHTDGRYAGVHTNPLCHLKRRVGVNVNVTNAFVVLDHRHFRMGDHGANQFFAAAWDDEIDVILQLEQFLDESMVFRLNNLHRFPRHARLRASLS